MNATKTYRMNDTVEVYTRNGWKSGWYKGITAPGRARVMLRNGGDKIAKLEDIRSERRDPYGVTSSYGESR